MILLRPNVRHLVNKKDIQALIRATRHWRGEIRAEAAAALGALRTVSAVPELLQLLNDRRTEVREAAARALGDIGRTEAVDPLVEALGVLKSRKDVRRDSNEYELEAIAEALGKLNTPKGVASVLESGTVRARDGFFDVSRPHIAGLCLSGGAGARAALRRIVAEHDLYETGALIVVFEALEYLNESLASGALTGIVNECVECLKLPPRSSDDPIARRNLDLEVAALAAARVLGRWMMTRSEPVLIELLLRLPVHSSPGDGKLPFRRDFTDLQNAILTIRGEKSPVEFDCRKGSLRLHDYQVRRHKTDVEYGGIKRWTTEAAEAPL